MAHNPARPARSGPLIGLKIVDCSATLMGPYCTQILADLGADVIKVESPEGDTTRYLPPQIAPGNGAMFVNMNRGKRSLVLDLKKPQGCSVLLKLSEGADLFVHSMRRAAIQRLGFGYEALAAQNPRLVYLNLYGYGQGGPQADDPAYDDVIQAASGLAHLQGVYESGAPRYMATVVADKVSGLTGAYAALAALYHREKTGHGQEIEVPMFETLVSFAMTEHLLGGLYDPPIGAPVYPRAVSKDRRPYRTRDGFISVLVYTDKQWQNFVAALDHPAWSGDPMYKDFPTRAQNIDAVLARLAQVFAERDTAAWIALLRRAEIPAAPVRDFEALMSDAHLNQTGFWVEREEDGRRLRFPGIPTRFSRTPGAVTHAGPALGTDSHAVLAELGYDEGDIAALIESGAVGVAEGE